MNTPASDSDEKLMLAYQAGDAQAFELLYHRHSGKVYAYLKKRLHRKEEIDEVFQLIFTKLHKSRETYSATYTFTQWLFVVTRTVLLDHWKSEGRKLDQPGSEPFDEGQAGLSPATQERPVSSDLEVPEVALRALPVDQRKALELRVLDDLTYEEIAKRLGRSQDNVRQMVSRAIKKLRDSLGVSAAATVSPNKGKGGGGL